MEAKRQQPGAHPRLALSRRASFALLQSLVAPALPTIEDELNASTTAAGSSPPTC